MGAGVARRTCSSGWPLPSGSPKARIPHMFGHGPLCSVLCCVVFAKFPWPPLVSCALHPSNVEDRNCLVGNLTFC